MSQNIITATAAIRAHFDEEWDGATDIAYDDVPFEAPDAETWVRLTVRHVEGQQASMGAPGANRYRYDGFVIVQVFQPQGKASIDARAKAQAAVDIFRGLTLSGIDFYNVSPREVGSDGKGFYQINVYAYFRYDEIA